MHQSLYRKYRPSNFNEVVGQKIIVKTLENAIKNNVLSHAYLFAGPRGTGKTSIAKILAKTINCKNIQETIPCNECICCQEYNENKAIDIIEIDAASNNGVDEIRELRSKVSLVPSIGKYKIYIIDEVHMLTTGAFNALLKTLEEPPSHVIFILATTDPHKIPPTILSRCQRFDFKKIPSSEMKKRINIIIDAENILIDEKSIDEIVRISDGGMRDALSILDQLVAYCENDIKLDDVHEINGTITPLQMKEFISNICDKNIENVFKIYSEFNNKGKNFIKLAEEMIIFMRNIMLKVNVPKYFSSLNVDEDIYNINNFNYDEITKYIEILNKSLIDMKDVNNPQIIFELMIINMMNIHKKEIIDSNPQEKNKFKPSIDTDDRDSNIGSNKNIVEENINDEKLNELVKIRLNNTLCYFDKKYYLNIKNNINILSDYLLDPKYGEYASIVLDGNLKAAGNNYLIFVYDNVRLANLFNNKISYISDMLENIFSEKYIIVATDTSNWDVLKNQYNSRKVKFEYIEEPKDLIIKQEKDENNEIEKEFSDIIEYN